MNSCTRQNVNVILIKGCILIILFLLHLTPCLSSQTVSITGRYADKKDNPIQGALVEYFRGGDHFVDSTRTDANGHFTLVFSITGVKDLKGNLGLFLSDPHPNPFTRETQFMINTQGPSTVMITDMGGVVVNQSGLPEGGMYLVSWGGLSFQGHAVVAGTYVAVVRDAQQRDSRRVILLGTAMSGLTTRITGHVTDNERTTHNTNMPLNKSGSEQTQDMFRFTREHTTTLEITRELAEADTDLGTVRGNTAPQPKGQMIMEAHLDSLTGWDLGAYFSNDREMVFSVVNKADGFIIDRDVLIYQGADQGRFRVVIRATDADDALLWAEAEAEVTIRNERHVTVSGVYANKRSRPIQGAGVSYVLQGGDIIGTDTTDNLGAWSMRVTLNQFTDKAVTSWHEQGDHLLFEKTGTSTLRLFFGEDILGDTLLGEVTGNTAPQPLGDITQVRFSVEDSLIWDMRDMFYNDREMVFEAVGEGFAVVDGHLLMLRQSPQGGYHAGVIARDGDDQALSDSTMVDIEVVPVMAVGEEIDMWQDAQKGDTISHLGGYVHRDCTLDLGFEVIYQTHGEMVVCATKGDHLVVDSIGGDYFGKTLTGLKVINLSGSGMDTVWFYVRVKPVVRLGGVISDILDATRDTSGAEVGIYTIDMEHLEPLVVDTLGVILTDDSGSYQTTLRVRTDTLGYYYMQIRRDGYTPRHTWLTIDAQTWKGANNIGGADTLNGSWISDQQHLIREDYTIFRLDEIYELYRRTMRGGASFPGNPQYIGFASTTRHWIEPPGIHVYGDTSQVGGQNIDTQVENLFYNARNILPVFNPDYAKPENVVYHETFGYFLQDNEMGTYFTNSIPGAGAVSRIYEGPRYKNCIALYRSTAGIAYGADDPVFNQELGSCFGAVSEPPINVDLYVSVFNDPVTSISFSEYDLQIAKLYLDRSKIHYNNLTYDANDPEGWDWEARPDIIDIWYNPDLLNQKSNEQEYMEIIDYDFDGSVMQKRVWKTQEVPSSVMQQYPMLFTPQDIISRQTREQKGH